MSASSEPQPRRPRGRPSIVPGEASVEIGASIERSLYERLQRLAMLRREDERETIRQALREFIGKKLPDTGHYS